ncbi:hypothetical protein [Opitutus terrae]|uniref:Uncharacterized protein n=1 Tax=Opitutus terrae (strain DSM 11246 / JCM 15787 / PB90-1) TaxID=452637 RepID=B1ZVL8_OPITP|nr:hypothetical protein [Opitutus terrae]ACB74115.1 hypothetical protein Oter_0827 [Opitutus terrae PB90-1]
MFHNLLQAVSGRPPPESSCRFIEEVRLVEQIRAPHPGVEKLILGCWLAIAGKCALVVWLIDKYHMGFSPLWVNAPTVGCGLICTALYFLHD